MTKKVDIRLYAGALSKIQELQAKLSGESFVSHEHYTALKLERDQLVARVGELEEACECAQNELEARRAATSDGCLALVRVLNRSKPASLARHDAEVLRRAATGCYGHNALEWLLAEADRIEQENDGGK